MGYNILVLVMVWIVQSGLFDAARWFARVICRNDPLVMVRLSTPKEDPYAPPSDREQETRLIQAVRAFLAIRYLRFFGLALFSAMFLHLEAIPFARREGLLELTQLFAVWGLLVPLFSYLVARFYVWLSGSESRTENDNSLTD